MSSLILWVPFLTHQSSWFGLKITAPGFYNIYKQYDGPLYIIPAKTLYDKNKIDIRGQGLIISLPLSPGYFAAHFPLYPILIRGFAEIGKAVSMLGMNPYLKSMISVNILSTIGLTLLFFFVLKKFKLTKNPLVLSSVLLFLPRFLVVRSTGAPESLFLLLILSSLYFFEKKSYWWAGLLGGLSVVTKSPGILLFFVYSLVVFEEFIKTRKIDWRWIGITLIPLGLLGVFGLYKIQYGDFFAYFHSGNNIHLVGIFSAFNFQNNWVGTAWLEDIIFYFFLYLSTIWTLKDSKHRSLFYFGLVFFVSTLFIAHRDIARYSLPLWPLALIAHEKFFTSKKFIIVFLLLLPAIYLYAWNFLLYNNIPISDWEPFL